MYTYSSDEADKIIEDYKPSLIGKEYILYGQEVIITELIKKEARVNKFKIWVQTNSLYEDELHVVLTKWPLFL